MDAKLAAELGDCFVALYGFQDHFGLELRVVNPPNRFGHCWTFCRAKLKHSSYPTCPVFGEHYTHTVVSMTTLLLAAIALTPYLPNLIYSILHGKGVFTNG